jgi:hypothetical protein
MRIYLLMFVFLTFYFCKKPNLKKDKILYGNLYEYKGLYNEFSMVDCPDFVKFLEDGSYYVMNDCGIWGDPRIDTIAETGKYRYFKKQISFFDRKIKRNEVAQIFSSNKDTISLEMLRISKDTLVFKGYKLDVFKKNKLDTLPLPIYFSRVK